MLKIIYSCGHIEEVAGNDEILKHRNICPKCKEEKIKEGRRKAKELKLPKLLGTPKQVESAEGLRMDWINFLEKLNYYSFAMKRNEKTKVKNTIRNYLNNIIHADWYLNKIMYKDKGMIKYCHENPIEEKINWKVIESELNSDKFAIAYYQSNKNTRKISLFGTKNDELIKFFREKKYQWVFKNKTWIYEDEDCDNMDFEIMFKDLIEKLISLGFTVYYEKGKENNL